MWALISGGDQPGEQGGERQRWNKGANGARNRKWKKVRRNRGDSNKSRKNILKYKLM